MLLKELSDAQNSRIHAEHCMISCENILQLLRTKLKDSVKQNNSLKSLLKVQKDQARELREDFVDVSIFTINVQKIISVLHLFSLIGDRKVYKC